MPFIPPSTSARADELRIARSYPDRARLAFALAKPDGGQEDIFARYPLFPSLLLPWGEMMNANSASPDVLKEMTGYVLYLRTGEGTVWRRGNYPVFWCYESLIPYRHEELLSGWPESRVFWARPAGPSIGIAPLGSLSRPD